MVTRRLFDRTRGLAPLLSLLLLFLLPGLSTAEETIEPAVEPGVEKEAPATGMPAEGEAPIVEDDEEGSDLAWEIKGFVRGLARVRRAGSDSDVDVRADVIADATYHGDLDLDFRINGRIHWDAYGNQTRDDLLYDYWDTFSSEARGRLYEAHVGTKGLLDGAIDLRAGRQFFHEGVPFHLDGLRVDVDLGEQVEGLDVTALGGLVVYYDERGREEDWVAGLVARYRPMPGTTLRLEYYYVSEDDLSDDYVGLSAWHRIHEQFRVFGRTSLLDGELNELQLRGRFHTEDGVWAASLEFYKMFERLREVTNDLNPYVPLLGAYEPFWRLGGRVEFRPDDHWLVAGGYSRRELEDDDDEGVFNHAYDRYYLTATSFGLVDPDLDLTAIVQGFESDFDDTIALGGQADYQATPDLTVGGGIDWTQFKYFYLEETEREDVWTYWVDARWRFSPKVDLRGRASIDEDEFHTYLTFEMSVTVRF